MLDAIARMVLWNITDKLEVQFIGLSDVSKNLKMQGKNIDSQINGQASVLKSVIDQGKHQKALIDTITNQNKAQRMLMAQTNKRSVELSNQRSKLTVMISNLNDLLKSSNGRDFPIDAVSCQIRPSHFPSLSTMDYKLLDKQIANPPKVQVLYTITRSEYSYAANNLMNGFYFGDDLKPINIDDLSQSWILMAGGVESQIIQMSGQQQIATLFPEFFKKTFSRNGDITNFFDLKQKEIIMALKFKDIANFKIDNLNFEAVDYRGVKHKFEMEIRNRRNLKESPDLILIQGTIGDRIKF